MKQSLILFISSLSLLTSGCSHSSLKISREVKTDFEARRNSLNSTEYFDIFDQAMPDDVRAAMEFLYAYMPLPDLTDYPGEYFRDNVELALRVRSEMPWGKSVPDREFLHFVLPIRVNNENLDVHRQVFYDELRDRIKGMSMADAILEVNHWCHEKVTYQPSDSRTHSPLASISSGIGRCGEESTFTVAALRSIGIPARQVYTPRWAHTDDNHAWVEAWADGQWHFLGACEPEAVLDLGWFNAPAARGMLMNTRAIGHYDGPEEKLLQKPDYTDINVTENYAPVDTLHVTVVDAYGSPLGGAVVDFSIYNYAEFYPVASKTTDADGRASIVAGRGDMIIWASHNGKYAMRQASVGHDRNIEIAISPDTKPSRHYDFDLVPPSASAQLPDVSDEQASNNDRRKAYEDSIRTAYVNTFTDKSRGNKAVIDRFLASLDESDKARGQALLDNLTDKDLTDVTYEVLTDAMLVGVQDSPMYAAYVLSPRIDNEFLVPFRAKFADAFSSEQVEAFRGDPASWAKWVTDSISADMQWQPSTVRMSPWSVWRLRHTNAASRGVFFVAAARAMGIPSRIDPVTGKAQYADVEGLWHDMATDADTEQSTRQGYLSLRYDKQGYIEDPGYFYHFSISKINDGRLMQLAYPEDATYRSGFSTPVSLDAGEYMLMSGQRQADGSVLASVDFFTVEPGLSTALPFTMRQDSNGVKIIGNFNSENLYSDFAADAEKSILSTTGRGYYVLGLVANNDEPSNHALSDIAALADELSDTDVPTLVLFPTIADARYWIESPNTRHIAHDLNGHITLGADIDSRLRREITENMRLQGPTLPIFIIADTFNRVVFVSEGYTIGLGRQLLDTISKLQ